VTQDAHSHEQPVARICLTDWVSSNVGSGSRAAAPTTSPARRDYLSERTRWRAAGVVPKPEASTASDGVP